MSENGFPRAPQDCTLFLKGEISENWFSRAIVGVLERRGIAPYFEKLEIPKLGTNDLFFPPISVHTEGVLAASPKDWWRVSWVGAQSAAALSCCKYAVNVRVRVVNVKVRSVAILGQAAT